MSESNGYATRDEILGQPFKRTVVVEECCGRKFRIRNLTAGEFNTVGSKHLACDDEDRRAQLLASLPARFIVQQWVDENGHRVLSDTDVVKLLDQGSDFVEQLAALCQKHSGKKDVEGAEKNSGQIPNSAPPT